VSDGLEGTLEVEDSQKHRDTLPPVALFRPVATTADLPALGAGRESGTYDFKGAVDPTPGPKRRELAKDAAAFANATGGVVLVGAEEDEETGTLRKYNPMPEGFAESVKAAYDSAVADLCRPQPVIDAVRVKAPAPFSGYVVAVNVNPTPLSPVGVRWIEDPKNAAWAFPLRTTTHTAHLSPTELAMLMVPEIRRAAILLDSIPLDQRNEIVLLSDTADPFGSPGFRVTLVAIDPTLTSFTVDVTSPGHKPGRHTLPVDCVRSVWRQDTTHWIIAMAGRFSGFDRTILFVPR
jgi:hypothetical protein